MKNDYKNINGLVVGVRALLKREGIKVGSWYQNGRIKGMNDFTGGAEVRSSWDEVQISMYDEGKYGNPTMQEVKNILDNHGIEYKEMDRDIYIPAEKYCIKVRP